MPYQTGLPAALAATGLKVELHPGWATRGGSGFAPRGAVCHWTAGPKGTTGRPSLNVVVNGRSDLPGPLCNVYLDRNGVAVVVAAGTANHAGAGGWKGLTGNSQVWGTEAECGGDGDWTPAQRAAYPKVNAAFARLARFGADMVCGHNEWAPTRKIDIRDWPMSAMRTQVAALLAQPATAAATPPEDDMPTAQEIADAVVARTLQANKRTVGDTLLNIEKLLGSVPQAVADYPVMSFDPTEAGKKNPAWSFWANASAAATRSALQVAALQDIVRTLVEARNDDSIDADALLQRVDDTVRDAMASTVNVQVSVDEGA